MFTTQPLCVRENPRCLVSDWMDAASVQKSGGYRKKKKGFLGPGSGPRVVHKRRWHLFKYLEFKVPFN